MATLLVTGTDTGVGKTVTTAALAAVALAAGRSVAVLKPAQTGVGAQEPGDVAQVSRLTGGAVTTLELARFPDPLAPQTAARRTGRAGVGTAAIAEAVRGLAVEHDLVLVEGAGGLLVRFDEEGSTLADLAVRLRAPVLVVAAAGLGTLNATALTTEALRTRGVVCAGLVVGSWPPRPGLAERCNVEDLPAVAGVGLSGMVPAGVGDLGAEEFAAASKRWLAPELGGVWSGDVAGRAGRGAQLELASQTPGS